MTPGEQAPISQDYTRCRAVQAASQGLTYAPITFPSLTRVVNISKYQNAPHDPLLRSLGVGIALVAYVMAC